MRTVFLKALIDVKDIGTGLRVEGALFFSSLRCWNKLFLSLLVITEPNWA
jgi:hypothetical protein